MLIVIFVWFLVKYSRKFYKGKNVNFKCPQIMICILGSWFTPTRTSITHYSPILLCTLFLCRIEYRGGPSQTPRSVPFSHILRPAGNTETLNADWVDKMVLKSFFHSANPKFADCREATAIICFTEHFQRGLLGIYFEIDPLTYNFSLADISSMKGYRMYFVSLKCFWYNFLKDSKLVIQCEKVKISWSIINTTWLITGKDV